MSQASAIGAFPRLPRRESRWNVGGVAVVAALLCGARAVAQNVDVSTIPVRDTVQLTIYNSADLTLVRETRHLTFRRGMNPIQFSWANTLIDPSSVNLRFRTHADDLEVLDTTFPHDKPQMLYWNIESAFDGDAVIEVSYFTSGITWAADYACVANPGETAMRFEGFVRITNNSGEAYADAEVRLVVGDINLVETIEELAQRGMISEEERAAGRRAEFSRMNAPARRQIADRMERSIVTAETAIAQKDIVKEGLSEYFIFSIPGTETIDNGWSKRMRLFEGLEVPFDIKYRYRPQEYGDQLVRLFVLRNDEKSKLGTTPLPDGAVRLFGDNGRDGLSYRVTHHTKYVPIGQEIEINLGRDPEVLLEPVIVRTWRDDFWFHRGNERREYSLTGGERILTNDAVVGWDDHEARIERIRNYRDKPVNVELRHSWDGHVVFTSDLDPALHDYRTTQVTTTVPAATTRDLAYEITYRQGVNRKQNNVTLEPAP